MVNIECFHVLSLNIKRNKREAAKGKKKKLELKALLLWLARILAPVLNLFCEYSVVLQFCVLYGAPFSGKQQHSLTRILLATTM